MLERGSAYRVQERLREELRRASLHCHGHWLALCVRPFIRLWDVFGEV